MENYIDNAIVQEESAKNTEPNAENKETINQEAEKINHVIAGEKADIQDMQLSSSDKMPRAKNDRADASFADNDLAESTKPQGADHPTIDIAEAMRKIMNFTSSVSAQKEDGDSADYDDEKSVNYDDTSLLDSDTMEEINDDAFFDAINNDNSGEEAENIEKPSGSIEAPTELSNSEDNVLGDDADEDNNDEQDIDDDEDILEDEFGSIPDSFFDEDFSFDDDNSSISALLYDDDDDNAKSDFEKSDSISFAKLKEEMQRIKNEAIELREVEEVNDDKVLAPSDENVSEESPATAEEESNIIENAEQDSAIEEELADTQEDTSQAEAPIIPEKKSYVRDIRRTEITEEEQSDERGEHIITIDRTRIKDRSVPEGRAIDVAFDAAELFTFAFLIIMMLLCFVFRNTTVSGESMMPTFNDGDKLIISNLFYEPQRGDVVVFDDRTNTAYDDIPIIKRIIGLEGDVVKIEGGIIMVKENGSDEFTIVDYVKDMDIPYRDMDEVTVGKGEMFVMGDNVNNSLDSTDRDENNPTKNVGNIKIDSILGKVILRFYSVETVYSEETQEWVQRGRIVFDTNFTQNKP